MSLVLLVVAAVALGQPVTPTAPATIGNTAWVFTTIEHSEWCPAGNVWVDLRTGRFELTHRASRRICGDPALQRPLETGAIHGTDLARARAAYLRARTEGLTLSLCLEHKPLPTITISNGGPQILVLTSGASSVAAPNDLSCWSESAWGLQRTLDDVFKSAQRR